MSITEIIPDLLQRNAGRPVTAEIRAEAYVPPDSIIIARVTVQNANGSWNYFEAVTMEMAHMQACCYLHKAGADEQATEFDAVTRDLSNRARKEAAA